MTSFRDVVAIIASFGREYQRKTVMEGNMGPLWLLAGELEIEVVESFTICAQGHLGWPAKDAPTVCTRIGFISPCPAETVRLGDYPAVVSAMRLSQMHDSEVLRMVKALGAFKP